VAVKDAAKPDLDDVKYDAFLANDRTLGDPEVVKVEPGGLDERLSCRSGELDAELIAVDGFRMKAKPSARQEASQLRARIGHRCRRRPRGSSPGRGGDPCCESPDRPGSADGVSKRSRSAAGLAALMSRCACL
jgi:hypothetical protein